MSFIRDSIGSDYKEGHIIESEVLDIYVPSLCIGFNLNDFKSHNELSKEKKYHLNQTKVCESCGIHLVQIYEDDWVYKGDVVKSRILNLLGNSRRIYGRKCQVQEVSFQVSKSFLVECHIQGFCSDKIRLGLYNNGELVALMTFGKLRRNLGQKNITDNDFELLRYCNALNTSVTGGAGKLFKYFIRMYNPKTIISYADRSWTMNNGGTLYDRLGFENLGTSDVNYHYILDNKRKNRFTFRKDILIKDGFDGKKTEHQIMLDREIYRIYNSGQIKFRYVNQDFQTCENNLKELFN